MSQQAAVRGRSRRRRRKLPYAVGHAEGAGSCRTEPGGGSCRLTARPAAAPGAPPASRAPAASDRRRGGSPPAARGAAQSGLPAPPVSSPLALLVQAPGRPRALDAQTARPQPKLPPVPLAPPAAPPAAPASRRTRAGDPCPPDAAPLGRRSPAG